MNAINVILELLDKEVVALKAYVDLLENENKTLAKALDWNIQIL